MHNLSMTQALSIWSELEAAYYKKNGFGTDTAEIYIYTAMPYDPTVASLRGVLHESEHARNIAAESFNQANESLCALFTHFSIERDAHIEVEGRELGDWLKTARFDHRIHVKVTPRTKGAT